MPEHGGICKHIIIICAHTLAHASTYASKCWPVLACPGTSWHIMAYDIMVVARSANQGHILIDRDPLISTWCSCSLDCTPLLYPAIEYIPPAFSCPTGKHPTGSLVGTITTKGGTILIFAKEMSRISCWKFVRRYWQKGRPQALVGEKALLLDMITPRFMFSSTLT